MSELGPEGSSTHPLGWTFIGAGAILWLVPACTILGHPIEVRALGSDALAVAVLVALAAAIGLLFEVILVPVETFLLWATRLAGRQPPREAWGRAWRVRWKLPAADQEFRRTEALTSFSRAYFLHSLLGMLLWARLLWHRDGCLAGVLVLVFGLFLLGLLGRLWYLRTSLVFTLVNSAASWSDEGLL